ncbi:MAG: superoxide dismutase [Ni], partial [Candidatus Omnitrophota bacterium]
SGTMSSNEKKKYIEQLTLLHEILVYAMKAKQTTDLANVEKLRSLLGQFREAYLDSEDFKPGKRRKYRP